MRQIYLKMKKNNRLFINTKKEADEAISEIRKSQMAINAENEIFKKKKQELEGQMAKLSASYQDSIKNDIKKIEVLIELIYDYAEKNRKELTPRGEKTVTFPSGSKISWKLSKKKVKITEIKKVIAHCEKIPELWKFLRKKFEIDKSAMIKDSEKANEIPGVTVLPPVEQFSVQPAEIPAIIVDVQKLKRHLPALVA